MAFAAVGRRNDRVGQPASQIVIRHANQPATRRQSRKVFHNELSFYSTDNAAMWSNMNVAAEVNRRRNIRKVVNCYVVADRNELRIFDYHVGSNPHVHAAPL